MRGALVLAVVLAGCAHLPEPDAHFCKFTKKPDVCESAWRITDRGLSVVHNWVDVAQVSRVRGNAPAAVYAAQMVLEVVEVARPAFAAIGRSQAPLDEAVRVAQATLLFFSEQT